MTTATIPAPSGFARRDLWDLLLDRTTADVKDEASTEVRAWLRQPENLVNWQRALAVLEGDVNARLGDARLRLDALKPPPGENASAEYLEAKRDNAVRHASRLRFRNAVATRLKEARVLLDAAGIRERLTQEAMLETIARAADFLDREDFDAALNLLDATLREAEKVGRL